MKTKAPNQQTSRRSGSSRVLWLTFFISTLALLIGLVIGDWPALPGAPDLPSWIMIPAVYLSELTVVHFRGKRDAHSFSMSEIPLIFGLVTVTFTWVMA